MRKRVAPIASAALAVFAPTAHADLTGKAEAGVVLARGNTESSTANAKLDIAREYTKWKHNFFLAGLYAEDEIDTTANRYETRLQSNYKFTPRAFWFAGLRYEDDEFSGFDYQASATTGIGYKFIETTRTTLDAQIGTGYRQLRDSLTGEETGDVVARGDFRYEFRLSETAKITNTLISEWGEENTFVGNDLSLEVKVWNRLALGAGYGVRYNSDPGPDLKRTDTLTTLNLVYTL